MLGKLVKHVVDLYMGVPISVTVCDLSPYVLDCSTIPRVMGSPSEPLECGPGFFMGLYQACGCADVPSEDCISDFAIHLMPGNYSRADFQLDLASANSAVAL